MFDETKAVNAAPAMLLNGVPETKDASGAAKIPADSPAPWTLKGEGYGIPFKLKPGKLPPGLYHPLDTPPGGPENDDFQGGSTALHIWQLQILIHHSRELE
jgi:hypothetical protein